MKVVVEKKEFVSAMSDVLKIVPKKAIIPMVEYALMKVSLGENGEPGKIVICGTDLVHMIFKSIPAKVEGEAKDVIFNIQKMHDLCKKISDNAISFEIKDKSISIKSVTGKYDILTGDDPTLFPIIAFTEDDKKSAKVFTMPTAMLSNVVSRSSKYIDINDTLRPTLHNVYMVVGNKTTDIYSANMQFMVRMNINFSNEESLDTMISHSSVKFLGLLNDEQSIIATAPGIYSIVSGNTKIIVRGVEGKYPAIDGHFDRILTDAKEGYISFDFSKEMFIGSLERIKSLSNVNYPIVSFTFDKAELKIKLEDTESGVSGEERCECIINSDNKIKVCFNLNFLLTVINTFEEDTINFKLLDTNDVVAKPVVLSQTTESNTIDTILLPVTYVKE
jgi:DNA polymerase III sliding clamp (beta) subunit (PCNA family)